MPPKIGGHRETCYRFFGKLRCPVRRMKIHKGGHGRFLSTTMKKLAARFPTRPVRFAYDIFCTRNFPSSWSKSPRLMLAKKARAPQPSTFSPIANIYLLYKTFAFMIWLALKHCWLHIGRKNNTQFPKNVGGWRMFSNIQWGMSQWRLNAETGTCGFHLGDSILFLQDVRFADNILFARKGAETMAVLDDAARKFHTSGCD